MIFYANVTGCPLYIVHMTIKEGVDIVARAKTEGTNVIAETCPQYLVLNENNVDMLQSKVNPPIRTKEDNEALWAAIGDGAINHVATDHAPVPKKFKTDFWTAKMGMAGAETWLPIMLSEGVNKGRITLERLVEVCCTNPAKQYGLFPEKGIIAVGSDADLVIVDLDKELTVGDKPVFSLTEYNPYAGFRFKGWPVFTMLRGAVIMEKGKVIGKEGYGKYCRAKIK
jgi:dihydropyrimidinase/allantoinase